MSRSRKRARSPRKLPLWFSLILIALLSVVAIALAYLAVTGVGSGEDEGLPVKSVASAPTQATTSAPSPAAKPQPATSTAQVEGPTSQRMLALVGATAMRGTGGSCENPGTVEISLDGGQNWGEPVSLTEAGATQILRLLPTDPSLVQVVALDQDCDAQVYRSTDLGTTWEGPLSVAGTWYFDPSDPMRVGAPDGPQALPCAGVELAALGDRAAIRCGDGALVTTIDRGLTWSEAAEAPEPLAINYSADSYVIAQPGDETCEGVSIASLASTGATALDGCYETNLPAEALSRGSVAIAQSGTSTLLWVGDAMVTSPDGGTTWL